MRALPSESWSRHVVSKPRKDATNPKPVVTHIDATQIDDFMVYFTKEGVSDESATVGNSKVTAVTWAKQKVLNDVMGDVQQVPVESGYASSIHKSQGLTLTRVHGLLEGIFAHGQTYVLISRTPDNDQVWLVGVPPQDILLDVMLAVEKQQTVAIHFLQEWKSIDSQLKRLVTSATEKVADHLLPLRQHINCIWDRYTRWRPASDMSADEIENMLSSEVERLDLESGIEVMIGVTSRFTAGSAKDRKKAQGDAYKLHALVKYEQQMKDHKTGRIRPWANLKETLSPEPQASSTYHCIDQWLLAVDILERANIDELCEDARTAKGTIIGRIPFLHGRELPDCDSRWWGGFIEQQMREKEPPLPIREIAPLFTSYTQTNSKSTDAASDNPISITTLPTTRPHTKRSQKESCATTQPQLFVKCPSVCKQMVAVETVKLAGEGRGRVVWNCHNCRMMLKEGKDTGRYKITWHQLICVDCTDTSKKKRDINSCESCCPTKQAIEEKKTSVSSSTKDVRAFPTNQSSTPRIFKYNNEIYQSVHNFCDNYDGLKKGSARQAVVNTNFPTSAYLVIPNTSANNYRWIPDDWKNGHRDLSQVKKAAYLLEQCQKPHRNSLLLVAREELKKAAKSALSKFPPKPTSRKRTKKEPIAREAEANPLLPIVDDIANKDRDNQQNPFSTRHMALCPTCKKAGDVSRLSMDPRGRSRCPECKSQTRLLHWECVKCSTIGRRRQLNPFRTKFILNLSNTLDFEV